MTLSVRQKHLMKITTAILLVFVLTLFLINIILGNFIEKKLNRPISIGDINLYNLSVGKVRTNLLLGSIQLSNIQLKPDTALLRKARNGAAQSPLIFNFDINELRLANINLISAVTAKKFNIKEIALENPQITVLKGEKPEITPNNSGVSETPFSIDSIQIKGISGLNVKRILLNQLDIAFIDLLSSDTLMANKTVRAEIKGLALHHLPDSDGFLKLDLSKFAVDINNEEILLPGGDYRLSLNQISLGTQKDELVINGVKLKPSDNNLERFARKLYYTSEMYNVELSTVHLKKINLIENIKNGTFIVDSLHVAGLNLSILMDKSFPFNTEKRPQLPNHTLKNMDFPVYIGEIRIEESNLNYQEKMPDVKEPMTVTLDNLKVVINRPTSVKDSLAVRKDMTIKLQADFMNDAKMQINFAFPLYQFTDTFFYDGSVGPTQFPTFNKASFPAVGAKFTDGELNSLRFEGSANNTINTGEFTMLYNNLQAELTRKDYKTKNKLFSWVANTALYDANPGKNGETRVGLMHFERVPYKGFGNFMWKTIENGIINTVLPSGKKNKVNDDKNKGKKKERK